MCDVETRKKKNSDVLFSFFYSLIVFFSLSLPTFPPIHQPFIHIPFTLVSVVSNPLQFFEFPI